MKIIIEKNDNLLSFSELNPGDIFVIGNDYYMKLDEDYGREHTFRLQSDGTYRSYTTYNAFDLTTSRLYIFHCKETKVRRLNAKLVIKE